MMRVDYAPELETMHLVLPVFVGFLTFASTPVAQAQSLSTPAAGAGLFMTAVGIGAEGGLGESLGQGALFGLFMGLVLVRAQPTSTTVHS